MFDLLICYDDMYYVFRFAKPIYVDGEYPPIMRFQINKKSAMMNLTEERLPRFTEEEKKMIVGMENKKKTFQTCI